MNSNGTINGNGKTSDVRVIPPEVPTETVGFTETTEPLPEEAPQPLEAPKQEAPRKSHLGAITGAVVLIGLAAAATGS